MNILVAFVLAIISSLLIDNVVLDSTVFVHSLAFLKKSNHLSAWVWRLSLLLSWLR